MSHKIKKITVENLTKVEGHAKLDVEIRDDKVEKAELNVIETGKYFEGILKGKSYEDTHKVCSRICGICSNSHVIASLKTVEDALGVKVSKQTRMMRELANAGEIIQNHVIQSYFMVLPDFLGYDGAIEMAKDHRDYVKYCLHIRELGNQIVRVIGGREVHPMTMVAGGFAKIPKESDLKNLLEHIEEHKPELWEMVELFRTLEMPKLIRNRDQFALTKKKLYPTIEGVVTSVNGNKIKPEEFESYFQEYTNPYSTAKFVIAEGQDFLVGPLPRVNIKHKNLSRTAKKAMKRLGLKLPSFNIFDYNLARIVETIHLFDRSTEILEELLTKKLKEDRVKFRVKKGVGIGLVEAPRGVLFHKYHINKEGNVEKANIVTPTAQNLRAMEEGIKQYLPQVLYKSEKEIKLEAEKLIRAFDPCISCSAHFLELNINDR